MTQEVLFSDSFYKCFSLFFPTSSPLIGHIKIMLQELLLSSVSSNKHTSHHTSTQQTVQFLYKDSPRGPAVVFLFITLVTFLPIKQAITVTLKEFSKISCCFSCILIETLRLAPIKQFISDLKTVFFQEFLMSLLLLLLTLIDFFTTTHFTLHALPASS